jgi:uncharacterized protein (UPF0548 family)
MRLYSNICDGLLLLLCCSIVQAQKLQQAVDLVAHSTSALKQCVSDHPKLTAAVVYAGFAGVFIKRELGTSGLAIVRRPHLSFAPPSERYMCELLQIASQHEITNPVPGVTDSTSDSNVSTAAATSTTTDEDIDIDNDNDTNDIDEQEQEQDADSSETVSEDESDSNSSGDSEDSEDTDDEAETSESKVEAAFEFDSDDNIDDDTAASEKASKTAVVSAADINWKKTSEKVVLGQGASLYRRAVAGMMHFDQCDSIANGDIIMADSSDADDSTDDDSAFKAQVGITVGILSKVGVFWLLSPFRVVYTHSAIPPLLKTPVHSSKTAAATTGNAATESDADTDSDSSGSSSSSSKVYETSYGLSTVKGAGYTGEWRFSVSYDTATDNVYFEATLYRTSKGAIISSAHVELLHSIVQSMLERSEKDRKLLQVREKQRKRFAELAAAKQQQKASLKRDRVLHPEKYERKHKWTDDDGTSANSSGGRHRFGVERRADELGRMSR